MAKINLDKYYTPSDLAEYCVKKTKEIIGEENITEWLEPSAGAGVFLPYLDNNYLAFDIEPESDKIEQKNYLELDLPYFKGRCVIGNPPYGRKMNLAVKFFKMAITQADYVSFILPVSQYDNSFRLFEFDLVYSEVLEDMKYSGKNVKCCLNIYKRPSGLLNKKPNYDLKDVEIKEGIRGSKKRQKIVTKDDFNYDVAICGWGSSCGKEIDYEGQYAQEFYIKCNNLEYKEEVVELIKNAKWDEIYPMLLNSHKIQKWKVYKYLKKQIPELN